MIAQGPLVRTAPFLSCFCNENIADAFDFQGRSLITQFLFHFQPGALWRAVHGAEKKPCMALWSCMGRWLCSPSTNLLNLLSTCWFFIRPPRGNYSRINIAHLTTHTHTQCPAELCDRHKESRAQLGCVSWNLVRSRTADHFTNDFHPRLERVAPNPLPHSPTPHVPPINPTGRKRVGMCLNCYWDEYGRNNEILSFLIVQLRRQLLCCMARLFQITVS